MTKTGIIGHRGAAGLALENSEASLLAALSHNIDAIEFDVRRTRDGKLVVMHDKHTGRISKERTLVGNKTLKQLQSIKLKNGQRIMSFQEVFELLAGKIPMVIDIKDHNSSDEILTVVSQNPNAEISFTSLQYTEIKKLRKELPHVPVYIRDLLNPVEVVHTAKRMKATGISLNMWLMNPLTYWLAKKRNLEVRVYTVNNKLLGKLLKIIYPGIVLYTNHPQRFVGRIGKKGAAALRRQDPQSLKK